MSNINTSSMLAVGTMLNGRYRIERHLSSGGFGNTYLATSLMFNEMVAVKEFFLRGITQRDDIGTIGVSNSDNKLLFDEQLEKFKKEAQRIRQLRSPHIVHVHDLFEANGTAYYVMDYIDGESLADHMIRTGQPLSEAETRKYLGQVLDALATIHSVGLLHMDLKPDNIMIDKDDKAVLIDFGASKRSANEQLTSTVTAVSYTSGYAPPEQIEQDTNHFGPWTDIYALGATLYQLLTDRKPPMPSAIYSDPTADKHQSLEFPTHVSGQMRQLITKMMTVSWHMRPQSIEEVRRLMEKRYSFGAPPPPPPPPPSIPKAVNAVGPTHSSATILNPINEQAPHYGEQVGQYGNQAMQYEEERPYEYEEEEGSSSRKWIYVFIGITLAALIGGGIAAYKLLSKPESPNGSQSADSTIVTNDKDTLLLGGEGESAVLSDKDKIAETEEAKNGAEQEQGTPPPRVEKVAKEPTKTKTLEEAQAKTTRQEPTPPTPKPEPQKVEDNKVYDVVEQQPSFPGGQGAMLSWLSQNIRYPVAAQRNGVHGRVLVSFVVEKNGSVSDVRVLRSADPSLDNEAVRVVRAMPRWSPGKQNGQPVRVKYTLPVTFKL